MGEYDFYVPEAIGEGMPGGFFIYKAGGREEILYANSVMVSIFGCTDYEDFLNYTDRSFRGIVHPDDYIFTNHSIELQVQNDNVHFDHVIYRIRRKDGAIRWLNDYGRLVSTKEYGNVFYVFVSDETELHEGDEERRDNRQVIEAMDAIHLALGSGDWGMSFDERGQMKSCSWSRRFREMLGYRSLQDFPDRLESWSDLLVPEDRERVLAHYWDVVRDYTGGKTYDIVYRLMTKNRGIRWFRAIGRLTRRKNGSPIAFYGIFLDIDDEKRREIAEKEQYRAILEAISQEYHTMWLVNKQDHRLSFIRENAFGTIPAAVREAMENADVDEALACYIETCVAPEDRERVAAAVRSSVVLREIARQPVYSVNYRQLDGEGKFTFHQMAFADAGDGYILAYHDIDSIVREEEKKQQLLSEALKNAETANRAKSDFLQTMSHDIRTPMNGIIGMTAIAAAHIDDRERVKDSLQKITTASRHLLSLVNEVLDMSKIESGNIYLAEEELNLSELIDSLITMIRPQVRAHRHELTVNICHVEHELVIGDSIRLQQVFVNLMSNAIKYTPDGGKITLDIREIPSNQNKTGCYEFTFKDNGIGMPEDFLPKLFDPFTRVEDGRTSKVQGTGLGMPITKNIVNMMGGNIAVKSRLGEGSVFTVTIYLKLQEKNGTEAAHFADLSILVADDDELSMESAVEILRELSIRAEGVLSGQEAVQRVVSHHEEGSGYEAVILDWKMPGMDGIETAREIRKQVGENVPIIILSAYDWSEIEAEAKAAGVNAFIGKPLFKSRLVHVLNELMNPEAAETEKEAPLSGFSSMDLSGYRCLLAEDNELNAEIAEEILSETGMKIDHVWNGREAVEAMKRQDKTRYDLILMDIQMPQLNGLEAAREIRRTDSDYCRNIPIFAMTANAFADDVREAAEAGMNEHIAKPIDLKVLAGLLRKYMKKMK